MSVRQIQIQTVLDGIAESLFTRGIHPTVEQIMHKAADHFREFPAGLPLPIPPDITKSPTSVEAWNVMLARFLNNLEVLYQASLEQIDEIMALNTTLRVQIENLKTKRKAVERQIDDYLLSLYNTEGYFYSASDSFVNLDIVDLNLTSAYIDINSGTLSLPIVGGGSSRARPDYFGTPGISVSVDGVNQPWVEGAAFSNALDSFTNTAWFISVSTTKPSEVITTVLLPVTVPGHLDVSRVEFSPYGVSPVQLLVETTQTNVTGTGTASPVTLPFGNKIQTSADRMTFVSSARTADQMRFTLRKTEHDYTEELNGVVHYVYLFGAKDIAVTHATYDSHATYVSKSLAIVEELVLETAIDAVTLFVDDEIPTNTSIKYYVALDNGDEDAGINTFAWREIAPLGSDPAKSIVRFDGARKVVRKIVTDPISADEIQAIPLNTDEPDERQRNPTGSIIPGVDIYRLAEFDEAYLANSLTLEEGINTTRIYHIPYDADAIADLDYWVDVIADPDTEVAYGRIDTGTNFFYGDNVGSAGRSVFVETFLDVPVQQPALLGQLRKVDPNSASWSIRAFLNGREVGYLPPSTSTLLIPWAFQQGLNHIVLLINIPEATESVPRPQIGTVDLLTDNNLYDQGLVRLATWAYTTLFNMSYNERGEPFTFTIHDGELISRRKPTSNFRLSYTQSTGAGPRAIRVRADLNRETIDHTITPRVNSYSVRFSYGD